MGTTITKYDSVAVLATDEDLAGDALTTFSEKVEQCLQEGIFNFVVDCSEVHGMESASLEAILEIQDRCEDMFGSVKLCGLDETLTTILEITRLMRRFEVFEDVDGAVKSFG